jgi:argininosuccinate lyase
MMHLSRLSEELILWSTEEFSFIEMDDAFSTGSSIMPQKKNPDLAELVRAKPAGLRGSDGLVNLDEIPSFSLQQGYAGRQEALFDAVDTVKQCLLVFAPMLQTARFNKARMAAAAREDLPMPLIWQIIWPAKDCHSGTLMK